jgi:hypothetical protein
LHHETNTIFSFMHNETKTIYSDHNSPRTAQLSPKEATEMLAPLFLYTSSFLFFDTTDWTMPFPTIRWATSFPGRWPSHLKV